MGVMGGMADSGELAARLSSVVKYDRRGNVYYVDDFENTVERFSGSITAPGKMPVFSSDYCLSGSQCVLLDADATGISLLYTMAGVVGSQRLGMEVAIGHAGLGGSHLFEFHYLAQGIRQKGALRITRNAIIVTRVDLDIEDGAGAWQRAATQLYFPSIALGFGHIKLVCDFSTGRYVRLLYDAIEYDISVHTLAASAEAQSERTRVFIRSEGGGGVLVAKLYVDDLILTCQEP